MAPIWGGIVQNMKRLGEQHASMQEWDEQSEGSEEVKTKKALIKLIEGRYSEEQKSAALKAFHEASLVRRYYFECDFDCIVFFDDQKRTMLLIM